MLIIGFMSGSFLGQQMQFLELMPKFECADNEGFANAFKCYPFPKKDEPNVPAFCNNDLIAYHRVDYTDVLSLHNWIVDLKPDLTCVEQGFTSPIGLLGSM